MITKTGKRVFLANYLVLLLSVPLFAQGDGFTLGWDQLLPVHIVAMSLSGLGMIIGGFIARYRKKASKNWLKQHKSFQWTSAALAAIGIATGIVMVQVTTGIHLRVTHAVIALISFIFIVSAIAVAYGFLKGKKYKKQKRIMHRWIGRLTIVAWLTTILFGLFAAGIL